MPDFGRDPAFAASPSSQSSLSRRSALQSGVGAQANVLARLADQLRALEIKPSYEGETVVMEAVYAIQTIDKATTPSADTKAAYIGEFFFNVQVGWDEDGHETWREVDVPWCVIKEIMAGIRASVVADVALAAGTRRDETPTAAQSEGCQSGPKGNAQ